MLVMHALIPDHWQCFVHSFFNAQPTKTFEINSRSNIEILSAEFSEIFDCEWKYRSKGKKSVKKLKTISIMKKIMRNAFIM